MGLFSFSTRDPVKIAQKLARHALGLEVTEAELEWAAKLGIELHRLVSERNMLRVGMTEGGVATVAMQTQRTRELRPLEDALSEHYLRYFSALPNTTPASGELLYRRGRKRYIVRMPEEVTAIFHYYLHNPEAWEDFDTASSPAYAIPTGFQDLVFRYMQQPMRLAFDHAMALLR